MPENNDLGEIFNPIKPALEQQLEPEEGLKSGGDEVDESPVEKKNLWKTVKSIPRQVKEKAPEGMKVGRRVVKQAGEFPGKAVNKVAEAAGEGQTRITQRGLLKKAFWRSLLAVGVAAAIRAGHDIFQAQKKVTESGQTFEPKTATQQAEALVNDAKSIYSNDGLLDDSLGFNLLVDKNQGLTVFGNPEFVDNEAAITLTAEAGGPLWMLPIVDGKLPANIAQDLVGQLEGVSVQYLIDNTQYFHDNPTEWINFLGVHGAAPEVVEFLQYGYDIAHDVSQEPWQDRTDELRNWQPEAEPRLPATQTPIGLREHHHVARVEHGDYTDKVDFNEAIGVVCDATGLDFASIRGSMETVAVCGGDAVEMVSSYAYVPDVHSSLAGEMEMSASAYILIPLYLLRAGHDTVKGLREKIKGWLDKQQYRQMFDGLKERGKKFLTQKGTNNRDLS